MNEVEKQKLEIEKENRMAKLEQSVSDIKSDVSEIKSDLKSALSGKADKEEVAKNDKIIADQVKILDGKLWQIIVGVFVAMLTALIGLAISIFKKG